MLELSTDVKQPVRSASEGPELSLIMPCYNEQEVIPYTIPQLVDAFRRAGVRHVVLDLTGPFQERDAMLERFAARNVAMICGNPDIKVERGTRLVYCAGALAALYEEMGGTVTYAGKPHLPAYEMAFEALAACKGAPLPKQRILAIGDGLATDMKGAAAAGLRSVFIASALHIDGPLTEATLDELFAATPSRPIAAQSALVW